MRIWYACIFRLIKRMICVCYSQNLSLTKNARRPAAEAILCPGGRVEIIAWIILLVATQQTITNLVRSGRKQR